MQREELHLVVVGRLYRHTVDIRASCMFCSEFGMEQSLDHKPGYSQWRRVIGRLVQALGVGVISAAGRCWLWMSPEAG